MDVYKINGGKRLQGTIKVSGAKNSAVALIPASILADSIVTIDGLPEISDVETLQSLLEDIGGKVSFENGQMEIDSTEMISMPLPNGDVKKLRASYYLMGAMLGRFKHAVIGLPGGCHLGPRPIDQHIKGFEALGAKVTNEHGAIYLRASSISPSPITTTPCIGIVSKTTRIAVVAASSASFLSPRPIQRADDTAAASVTRTNSIDKLRSIFVPPVFTKISVKFIT